MTSERATFSDQLDMDVDERHRRVTTDDEKYQLAIEIDETITNLTAPFKTKFDPSDMRQLALVAHNHMKPAMKEFIGTYSGILQKFRITGTQTTMRMCKTLWGEDNPEIQYGLTCTSGPLGGDAQIAALMCMEDLGALIFFIDPLSAHPHQADIDSLNRLANCGNVIVCPNPTSAMSMMHTLRAALKTGNRGMIPSFFETLESPAVEEYKHQQELALAAAVSGNPNLGPMLLLDQSTNTRSFGGVENVESDGDNDDDDYEEDDEYDINQEIHTERRTRTSYLSGFTLPGEKEKKSRKKRIIKGIQKNLRRLNSSHSGNDRP